MFRELLRSRFIFMPNSKNVLEHVTVVPRYSVFLAIKPIRFSFFTFFT